MTTDEHTSLFEHERPRLTALAYRMLGRWTEAEDTVQDAFLRWQAAARNELRSPEAWLTTVVTRLSIDRIRRNRASREVYVGPWLPEPVITPEGGERNDAQVESLAGDLSLGLLHVLERLGPEERAAFILREAFDVSYADIASTLGKSEQAVRQVISRARTRVREERPRFETRPEVHEQLLTRFMTAVASGNAAELTSLFRPEIQLVSDGGGKRPAALRVLNAPDEVARVVLHIALSKGGPQLIRPVTLNGAPALWIRDSQGFGTTMQLDVVEGAIRSIFIVRNPDKLAHLGLH